MTKLNRFQKFLQTRSKQSWSGESRSQATESIVTSTQDISSTKNTLCALFCKKESCRHSLVVHNLHVQAMETRNSIPDGCLTNLTTDSRENSMNYYSFAKKSNLSCNDGGVIETHNNQNILSQQNYLSSQKSKISIRNSVVIENPTMLYSHIYFSKPKPSLISEHSGKALQKFLSNTQAAKRRMTTFFGEKSKVLITRDLKATKTLGVILGAFILCWLPFFILALLRPICQMYYTYQNEKNFQIYNTSNRSMYNNTDSQANTTSMTNVECFPNWLGSLFLWLGYANSLTNPIIYAHFNRDFRRPFQYLLTCRYRALKDRMRLESYAECYGVSHSKSKKRCSSSNHELNDLKQAVDKHDNTINCSETSVQTDNHNDKIILTKFNSISIFIDENVEENNETLKEKDVNIDTQNNIEITKEKFLYIDVQKSDDIGENIRKKDC